jgi:hypothetical protein
MTKKLSNWLGYSSRPFRSEYLGIQGGHLLDGAIILTTLSALQMWGAIYK